jgi:hypothetical protein
VWPPPGLQRLGAAISIFAAANPGAPLPPPGAYRNGRNTMATFAEHCVQSGLASFVELPANEAQYFTNWNSLADLPCTT